MYVLHGVQPVSLNNAYATKHKWVMGKKGKMKGRLIQIPYRFKLPEATDLQYMVSETLACDDFENGRPPLPWQQDGYALTIVIYMPLTDLLTQPYNIDEISPWEGSSIKAHDVSNDIKLIEDAIFKYLSSAYTRLNDCYNIVVTGQKQLSPDNDWHIAMLFSAGISLSYPVMHLGNDYSSRLGALLASR